MYAGELRKGVLIGGDVVANEDVLTAGALQPLDFLEPALAAAVVERWVRRPGFVAPVRFWPGAVAEMPWRLDAQRPTEPDAVLVGDGWVALVEAKCRAEFGDAQVEREFDVLLQELERVGVADGVIVLVMQDVGPTAFRALPGGAPTAVVSTVRAHAEAADRNLLPSRWRAFVEGKVTVEVVVLHWDELLDGLVAVTAGEAPHVARLAAAVANLLKRHGVVRPRALGVARFRDHEPIEPMSVRDRPASPPVVGLSRLGAVAIDLVPPRFRSRR